MFTRFNPAAKRVLRAAEQASRNHNHYYVGVGHLLLALLEERDAAVEARLAERATRATDILRDLRRALGTGDDRLWDGILVTPRVRRVVALAEAALPPDSPIEPLHLLEAIETEGAGLAAELLSRHTPPPASPPSGHSPPQSSGGNAPRTSSAPAQPPQSGEERAHALGQGVARDPAPARGEPRESASPQSGEERAHALGQGVARDPAPARGEPRESAAGGSGGFAPRINGNFKTSGRVAG